MTRTYFFSAKKYAKNSSLKTFDTKSVHPSTIVKNFVGDRGRKFTEHASLYYGPRSLNDLLAYGIKGRNATGCNSLRLAQPRPFYLDGASTPLQSRIVSPVKLLTIALGGTNVRSKGSSDKAWTLGRYQVSHLSGMEDKLTSLVKHFAIEDDLLAYGVKGHKATNRNSLCLAQPKSFYLGIAGGTTLQTNLMSPVKLLTIALGGTNVRSKGSSDKAWTLGRYQVSRPSGIEDRNNIIKIASAELGVKEATGNNDGPRIEQYLHYTDLGPGHEWCAAFVSWVYGQAGFAQPRNPWSPALFPRARSYKDTDKIKPADLFGIYSSKQKRIHHVGLIKEKQGSYILTIEGNSNNRVESRRRHQRTVYSYADWVD